MTETQELLRRLAAHDERCLQTLLLRGSPVSAPALNRATRALVELAALLATDASTPSVRCAADRAAATGVDDATLVHVLGTAAGAAGSAQMVKSAARLALALDVDTEWQSRLDVGPHVDCISNHPVRAMRSVV